MFVTPNRVSGLRVATGIFTPFKSNLMMTNSLKSGSTSPSVSCCETGF